MGLFRNMASQKSTTFASDRLSPSTLDPQPRRDSHLRDQKDARRNPHESIKSCLLCSKQNIYAYDPTRLDKTLVVQAWEAWDKIIFRHAHVDSLSLRWLAHGVITEGHRPANDYSEVPPRAGSGCPLVVQQPTRTAVVAETQVLPLKKNALVYTLACTTAAEYNTTAELSCRLIRLPLYTSLVVRKPRLATTTHSCRFDTTQQPRSFYLSPTYAVRGPYRFSCTAAVQHTLLVL